MVKRFIAGTTPWVPKLDEKSGRHFIWCPSMYRDNPHIDQDAYVAQLRAACANDEALLKAWLDGSFAVAKGAFFGSVIDENRNAIDPWQRLPQAQSSRGEWGYYLAHDFGVSAPGVTYVVAKSPGAEFNGRFFPRDSLVLIDELATNVPGELNRGMGYTVPVLAELIIEMWTRWGLKRAEGCAHGETGVRSASRFVFVLPLSFDIHGIVVPRSESFASLYTRYFEPRASRCARRSWDLRESPLSTRTGPTTFPITDIGVNDRFPVR